MYNFKKKLFIPVSCIAFALLNACGGGGGGGPTGGDGTTPPPTVETINNIAVPPAPVNSTASVAGTDSNNNGVRDDVERALATRVGTTPAAHTKAIATAKQIQTALTSEPAIAATAVQSYVSQSACVTGAEQTGVNAGDQEMLNNRQRQKAMIDAYVAMLDANPSGSAAISCQ